LDEQREWIAAKGWLLVVVHMQPDGGKLPISGEIEQLDDPHCELYRSFGLSKATLWQALRPGVWVRGVMAAARGHRGGALAGDGLQLPGTFLVRDGQIVRAHRARHVADHWSSETFADAIAT